MSILVPYRGVIEIVAEHDCGKTIAALQTVYPYKKTIFIDDDIKGDGTVRQMKEMGTEFEQYINLGDMRAKLGEAPTATQLLKYVVYPTIEKIASTKHDVIIWDTWRIVYQAARGHVEKNQNDFKDVITWRGTSTMIQGLTSKVARMIEQSQLNKLRNSCDLLIVTHHLKDHYAGGIVVGKIPESSTTFAEVSNMRLWLRRNINSKVPIILFLKRPNIPVIKKGKVVFTNIVPMKIVPNGKDESIWDAIKRYEENPIESREPTAEEQPTPEEMAMISGTISSEQKNYMMDMLKYQKDDEVEISEAVTSSTPVINKNVEVLENSNGYPVNGVQLLGRAKSEFNFDLTQIQNILELPFTEINSTYKDDYWDKLKFTFQKLEGNKENKNATVQTKKGGKGK